MTIDVYFTSAECGAGKTQCAINFILNSTGKYIYAVPRCDLADELAVRFRAARGSSSSPVIQVIHTGQGDYEGSIATEISARMLECSFSSHAVLFITHQALALMDWHRFDLHTGDWHLVVDEAPDVWASVQKTFRASHDRLAPLFWSIPITGTTDWLEIGLTSEGQAIRQTHDDDLSRQFTDLFGLFAKDRRCVAKASFFDATNDDRATLLIGSLLKPDHLAPFASRWFMAAHFEDSLLYRLWQSHGAIFHSRPLPIIPVRSRPLSLRAHIHFFAEHRATDTFFNDPAAPLALVADWIKANLADPFLYVFNEAHATNLVGVGNKDLGTKLTPKWSGSNQFADYRIVVWLAAMVPSDSEAALLDQVFGIDREQLVRAREQEALYQLVMRGNLRDFASNHPVDIYVFSREQADFLAATFGCPATFIDIGIPLKSTRQEQAVNKGGAKPKYDTDTERKEARKRQNREAQQRRRAVLKAA